MRFIKDLWLAAVLATIIVGTLYAVFEAILR